MDLHHSVAVVTGASRGIGLATSRALVAAGARVAGLARSQDQLDQLSETLGAAFTPVVCDVTDADAVKKAIDGVADDLGQIDVLVNNAGLGRFGPVDELPVDDWNVQVNTNLTGVFHCTRAAVPHMKRQGEARGADATAGFIVHVASIAGLIGNPNLSAYNATKHGLRGFSDATMKELRPFGIKTCCVYPGSVDTGFASDAGHSSSPNAMSAGVDRRHDPARGPGAARDVDLGGRDAADGRADLAVADGRCHQGSPLSWMSVKPRRSGEARKPRGGTVASSNGPRPSPTVPPGRGARADLGGAHTSSAMRLALLFALVVSGCSASQTVLPPRLVEQESGTDQLLIAAHAVGDGVVWVSGAGGTVGRTTDGGTTWDLSVVPGADTLQFRDVVAFDATTAWALSIGNGESSRIVKTVDGGTTWRTVFVNRELDAFFDCLSFWDADRGLAYSDSVDETFVIITTADGGETWQRVSADALPPAADGEGGFAASGTCVATRGTDLAWIATGNADPARVLRTSDGGATWQASAAPVVAGSAKGLASVAMRDDRRGLAVGGDIADPASDEDAVVRTTDGGESWQRGGRLPFAGAAYGVAAVPGARVYVAVGPGGAAVTRDDGRTWELLDGRTWWGVAAAAPDAVWLTGPDGQIARLRL